MVCSKMKFDKLDKIFTCFVLIIVTIFCVLNTFCFAAENVDYMIANDLSISLTVNTFQYNVDNDVGYFLVQSNYIYHISNNSNYNRYIALSSSVPVVGGEYQFLKKLEPGETFEFRGNLNNQYLYFDFANITGVTVTSEKVGSMHDSMILLSESLTSGNIWSVFGNLVPYILIVVLFAFGWWFFEHWIKEISKGREF